MFPAVAPTEQASPLPIREELLARFQQLDEIREHHYIRALDFVSPEVVAQHIRRLGVTSVRALCADTPSDLLMVYDLAIHTAPPGRSRAIDRYARNAPPPPGSEEASVLEAMCNARFAVLKVVGPHPIAGLILTDPMRNEEVWLVDDELETSLAKGTLFATRLYTPERFSITSGVRVSINVALLQQAVASVPQLVLRKEPGPLCEDLRFAQAIYRLSIEAEIRDHVIFGGALGTRADIDAYPDH